MVMERVFGGRSDDVSSKAPEEREVESKKQRHRRLAKKITFLCQEIEALEEQRLDLASKVHHRRQQLNLFIRECRDCVACCFMCKATQFVSQTGELPAGWICQEVPSVADDGLGYRTVEICPDPQCHSKRAAQIKFSRYFSQHDFDHYENAALAYITG